MQRDGLLFSLNTESATNLRIIHQILDEELGIMGGELTGSAIGSRADAWANRRLIESNIDEIRRQFHESYNATNILAYIGGQALSSEDFMGKLHGKFSGGHGEEYFDADDDGMTMANMAFVTNEFGNQMGEGGAGKLTVPALELVLQDLGILMPAAT